MLGEGGLAYVQHVGSLGYISMLHHRGKSGELREGHCLIPP